MSAHGAQALDARFFDCVHCGLCLDACPTYRELGTESDSPRGRIHLMRAVAEGRLPLDRGVERHLDLCLGCRACESSCPSGVRYGGLLELARAQVDGARRHDLASWVLRKTLIERLLPYPRRLAAAIAPLRVVDRLGARPWLEQLLPRRWRRLLRLVPVVRSTAMLPAVTPPRGRQRGTVALLRGCVTPVLFPDLLAAMVRVLSALGYRVVAPEGDCCGALHLHAGQRARGIEQAKAMIAAFDEPELDAIVVGAAGCGATMREYGELLASDRDWQERAAECAKRVMDVSEFVARELRSGVGLPLGRLARRACYHDACHLAHAQSVREEPRWLLANVPGLELVPLADADTCCGSAGTYNLTEPEMADRLAQRKVDAVLATGAEWVITGNPGCMLQIAAELAARRAPLEVLHTVEVMARALHVAESEAT